MLQPQELNGILATDFFLTDLEGNAFSLSDFSGKVIVIDFMATWCSACRLQIPNFKIIWEAYRNETVLMSIDIDSLESDKILRRFSQEFPYATWIWAMDTANLGNLYQVVAIPKTVIIDQEGYIKFIQELLIHQLSSSRLINC